MDKRARVVSVKVLPTDGLRRYWVTFDKEVQIVSKDYGAWTDHITCVAKDELDAWRIGENWIANERYKWRDKDGG